MTKKEISKNNKELTEMDNKYIVEDEENEIADKETKRLLKIIFIWLWLLLFLSVLISNMFFNIPANKVWVTEIFF